MSSDLTSRVAVLEAGHSAAAEDRAAIRSDVAEVRAEVGDVRGVLGTIQGQLGRLILLQEHRYDPSAAVSAENREMIQRHPDGILAKLTELSRGVSTVRSEVAEVKSEVKAAVQSEGETTRARMSERTKRLQIVAVAVVGLVSAALGAWAQGCGTDGPLVETGRHHDTEAEREQDARPRHAALAGFTPPGLPVYARDLDPQRVGTREHPRLAPEADRDGRRVPQTVRLGRRRPVQGEGRAEPVAVDGRERRLLPPDDPPGRRVGEEVPPAAAVPVRPERALGVPPLPPREREPRPQPRPLLRAPAVHLARADFREPRPGLGLGLGPRPALDGRP